MGRPKGSGMKSPALMDEIVDRISSGETLWAICRDTHMPSWRTVYDWTYADEEFASRIARARILGTDAIAQGLRDQLYAAPERIGEDGRIDPGYVQLMRVRTDSMLKLLAKWNPKGYGDKMTLAGDVENPLTITVESTKLVDLANTLLEQKQDAE